MSVTLSEVKRAARAHRAPLAGESAGYLVLALADQVLAAPRLVQAADIELTEDGALRVGSGHASSDVDAELALRRALDQLLLVASSGSAALTRASRRTAPLGLSALVRELEAALIPVNRSAARRALARVHRETARALESGTLPQDEETQGSAPPLQPAVVAAPVVVEPVAAPVVVAPVAAPVVVPEAPVVVPEAPAVVPEAPAVAASVAAPAFAAPLAPPAGPLAVGAREPQQPEPEPGLDLDQELETPALRACVGLALPTMDSRLDGVVSALCEELPAPPQFVESDALTGALAVRAVSVPAPAVVLVAPEPEPEPEFMLEFHVEFENAVDSSAAPTVMRAVEVAPLQSAGDDASDVPPPLLELPLEARTRPEPVVLRNALRPLLELWPKPSPEALGETVPETPTLGALATHLPILRPEQIAEMSVAASRAAELLERAAGSANVNGTGTGTGTETERTPEVLPLSPGASLVESKKSDLNELLESFQVAEPSINRGLCRAIKELADLDATPAPFAALIR